VLGSTTISTQPACAPSPRRVWRVFDIVSSVLAPVKEPILTSLKELSPAESEPLFNINVTSRSPLTGKRTCRLSNTIIFLAEVLDIILELELEDPCLAKRRRPSKRQTESLNYMLTPKQTPLATPSSPDSCYRASNKPSPSPLNNNS
jgi:hypothetical protein